MRCDWKRGVVDAEECEGTSLGEVRNVATATVFVEELETLQLARDQIVGEPTVRKMEPSCHQGLEATCNGGVLKESQSPLSGDNGPKLAKVNCNVQWALT